MAKEKKAKRGKWVELVAGVIKDALGEAKVEQDGSQDGDILITWGGNQSFGINEAFCEANGAGVVRDMVFQTMRNYTGNPNLLDPDQEKIDEEKRKLSNKAEAVNDALDIAGSSSEEKNEILKDA